MTVLVVLFFNEVKLAEKYYPKLFLDYLNDNLIYFQSKWMNPHNPHKN